MGPKGNMTHKTPLVDTEFSTKFIFSIDWAIAMNVSNLYPNETNMTYNKILQVKLGYYMGVTIFKATQLQKIHIIIKTVISYFNELLNTSN